MANIEQYNEEFSAIDTYLASKGEKPLTDFQKRLYDTLIISASNYKKLGKKAAIEYLVRMGYTDRHAVNILNKALEIYAVDSRINLVVELQLVFEEIKQDIREAKALGEIKAAAALRKLQLEYLLKLAPILQSLQNDAGGGMPSKIIASPIAPREEFKNLPEDPKERTRILMAHVDKIIERQKVIDINYIAADDSE